MTKIWLLLLVSLVVVASSRVYYVSPSLGLDSNDGSSSGPFKTLPRLVAELRASPIDTDVTVYLLNGTHYVTTPLDLSKVTYTAAGSLSFISLEKAVVSGAVRVNTTWTKSTTMANVYTTKFTVGYPTHQLFVGNSAYSRRVRARSPNIDVYQDNIHATNSPHYNPSVTHNNDDHVFMWSDAVDKYGLVYQNNDVLSSYQNQDQVQVVLYQAWTTARTIVSTVFPANKTLMFSDPVAYPVGEKGGSKGYYIENCLECLDKPGEWYYDPKSSTLYYYPLAGEDPNALDMYLTVSRDLFSLMGTGSNFIQNVAFKGIQFRHTEWACNACDGQSGHFLVRAAIRMSYARNITIEECEFAHTGEYAVVVEASTTDIKINKNHFLDMAGGGIKIGGSGPSKTSFVTVTNNYIHGGSRVFQAGTGILVQIANNITLAYNEIADMYYSGICVGWNWGYANTSTFGNIIENNYIHHIGQGELSDMAGIYTLGLQNGTRLRYNRIHDVLSSNYGGWGLYLDEGSSFIDVSHNIVYNTEWQSFHIHYGSYNHIFNNMLFAQGMGTVRWSKNDNYYAGLFDKNIFVASASNTPIENVFSDPKAQFDFGANVYVNISCGSLIFPLTFQDWQGSGRDIGSKFVNAPAIDDIKAKIAYYNALPAATSIGWEPIPLTAGLVSTDGLIKGSEWISLPKQYPFPTQNPSSYVYPILEDASLGRRASFETETTTFPKLGRANFMGGSYIEISYEQAVNPSPLPSNVNVVGWDAQDMLSKRSLKILDTDNSSIPGWYPYYEIFVPNAVDQYYFYSSDVFMNEGSQFTLEFRHPNGSAYHAGISLIFQAKNGAVTIRQSGTISGPALATDEWIHIELLFGLGDKSNNSFVITYWAVKQPSSVGKAVIPFANPYFALGLAWLGYISTAVTPVAFYVDNIIYGGVQDFEFEAHAPSKPLFLPNVNLPISILGTIDLCGVVVIVEDAPRAYAPYYFRRSVADLANISSVNVELASIASGLYNVTVMAIDYKHISINASSFVINIENPIPTTGGTSGSNTIIVSTTGLASPASQVICSGLWLFVATAILVFLQV